MLLAAHDRVLTRIEVRSAAVRLHTDGVFLEILPASLQRHLHGKSDESEKDDQTEQRLDFAAACPTQREPPADGESANVCRNRRARSLMVGLEQTDLFRSFSMTAFDEVLAVCSARPETRKVFYRVAISDVIMFSVS